MNTKKYKIYANTKNNLLKGYIGKYSGYINLIKKNKRILLYIKTTLGYTNYYYEIDITNTKDYYNAIRKSDKKPKYISVIINDNEVLMSTYDYIFTNKEIEEFNKFKKYKIHNNSLNKILSKKFTYIK